MFALLLIVFCFVFVIVKGFGKAAQKGRRSTQFQEFNDPSNFINPFNEFNN